MASPDVAIRPQQEHTTRRKPFAQWVKNLANLKNKGGNQDKSNNKRNGIPLTGNKNKKTNGENGTFKKNNPYPQSGHLQPRRTSTGSSANGNLSVDTRPRRGSYDSLPISTSQDQEVRVNGSRSGAPTLATTAETIHSDAGRSKAATSTTHGGAMSSVDGAGADSTFSSPSQSQHSLTTTLTTIQSQSVGNQLQGVSGHLNSHHHGSLNNPNPVQFSHQYPVSPSPSSGAAISAIPRHLADSSRPNTYNSATANNMLSDNASILTLASSSKRRRRSMDTDASVRALAPSSVWGGSRESLPLSVLSGNADTTGGLHAPSRPSIGGLASAERASIYSGHHGVTSGYAGERNSYYSYKPNRDLGDAKSLRSITNMDARSVKEQDAKSMADVGSLRYADEGSVRSGKVGHARNDSLPGSVGSPVTSPGSKHLSGGLSRRSSDWQQVDGDGDESDGKDDAGRPSLEESRKDEA